MLNYGHFPDYEHIRCDECNGVIGMYERGYCTCDKCGKVFDMYKLGHDRLKINYETGWIFPVKDKKEVL